MIIFLKKIVKCLCFSGELSTVIKMLGTEVFKFEVLFIVSLCEVSMLRSKSLVFHLPGQSLRIAMLRYSLGRPADFHADIFFQLFLLPQKMCLHHPGGFFNYILCTVLHSIQSFLWFFAIRTKSVPGSWYSLTRVGYLPLVTQPSQWVWILSMHYVQ